MKESASNRIVESFVSRGVIDFCGVPDSVLAEFSSELDRREDNIQHTIFPNEGSAVAYAIGLFLAKSEPCVVYLQNSGLGNAINPLISMASKMVAGIPMVLLVGYRGEPGYIDEPQHIHQGATLISFMELLGMHYRQVSVAEDIDFAVQDVLQYSIENSQPTALLISRAMMPKNQHIQAPLFAFTRRQAIKRVVDMAPSDAVFIATTGFASRELNEIFQELGKDNAAAFFMVGAMGHVSQVAMAVSKCHPQRPVVCIDGDGSALMHLGGFAMVNNVGRSRFLHILINNHCHESVGGQRVAATDLDYCALATLFGYEVVHSFQSLETFDSAIKNLFEQNSPVFVELQVSPGISLELSRPCIKPAENVSRFQDFLIEE